MTRTDFNAALTRCNFDNPADVLRTISELRLAIIPVSGDRWIALLNSEHDQEGGGYYERSVDETRSQPTIALAVQYPDAPKESFDPE